MTGHLTIGDEATIAGRSAVMSDIEPKAKMMGMPAMPLSHARRVYVAFTMLPELVDRIKKLERAATNGSEADESSEAKSEG